MLGVDLSFQSLKILTSWFFDGPAEFSAIYSHPCIKVRIANMQAFIIVVYTVI